VEDPLLYVAIGLTLCFAYVNGFHDGGNVIATAVCSRSLNPRFALIMGGLAEFIGPLVLGTAVASTMAESIFRVDLLERLPPSTLCTMIIAAVSGAMAWNLVTWVLGLPSSSSHALVGGLVGAGLVTMGRPGVALEGIVRGVVLPLLISPIIGIVIGYIFFGVIKASFGRAHRAIRHLFEVFQKPCVIFLAGSHGSNDAQKSMGVLAMLLAAGGGELHGELHLPHWVVVSCAAALAVGLVTGGWRMVKSVGYGICRMEPVHSFASQVTAASVIVTASLMGGPVSTTQVVASSVMGVGAQRRLGTVRWSAARNIAYAWFLTVPASGGAAAAICWAMERLIK
jgi:PiT family inorganic phosphate transporter